MGSACRFTGIQHRDVINDFQKPPFSSIYIIHDGVQLAITVFKKSFSVTVFNKYMWRGAKLDKNILVKQKRKNDILFRERFVVTLQEQTNPSKHLRI